MTNPDKRLNAWRDDLADIALRHKVAASHYVTGEPMRVISPRAGLHAKPDETSMMLTESLLGDHLTVFENQDGWAWAQMQKDNYVGYIKSNLLVPGWRQATHKVRAAATFIYPQADLKSLPVTRIFLNSSLLVDKINGKWAQLADGGFVYAPHICPQGEFAADPVAVAEKFIHVPYLWGGATQDGLDCSALVQQAWHASGLACPRDSDMIEAFVGDVCPNSLKRGDLVFWDGHVGIMQNETNMIHANGHHMAVACEPFEQARDRINAEYGSIARARRPGPA